MMQPFNPNTDIENPPFDKGIRVKRRFGQIPTNPCQASSMQLPWEIRPCGESS